MPHISEENEKLLEQLSVRELRHIFTTVLEFNEVTRILDLCLTYQDHHGIECNDCQSIAEKLEMRRGVRRG